MDGSATPTPAGPARTASGATCVGSPTCGAPKPGGRAQASRASLEALHRRFPADVEVTAFYALSLIGTAPPCARTRPPRAGWRCATRAA